MGDQKSLDDLQRIAAKGYVTEDDIPDAEEDFRKLKNQFHQFQTDDERAAINDASDALASFKTTFSQMVPLLRQFTEVSNTHNDHIMTVFEALKRVKERQDNTESSLQTVIENIRAAR